MFTNASSLQNSLNIIDRLFDGKVPSGSSVSISGAAYNSEEKQRLIDNQASMNAQEFLKAMVNMKEKQNNMSDVEKSRFIICEWSNYQQKVNQITIEKGNFDVSTLDFQMSVFDFAQYGFQTKEDILPNCENYIPYVTQQISASRILIYLQNCNMKSAKFGEKISIQASHQSGPDKNTIEKIK